MSESTGEQRRRPSLRERKKRHTRRTIADAAFALATEVGLENVLVEEIAERAFVSPRTLSNYFPSKEAAIVAANEEDFEALAEALLARPADEAPLASLRALLGATARGWPRERLDALRQKERLIEEHPTLLPFRMAQYDALEDALRTALAQRMDVDPEVEQHPRLLAGAAAAVVKSAIRVWVLQDGDEPSIGELVEAGFDEIANGLASD